MLQAGMQERLLKVMPCVKILKLRSELQEQNKPCDHTDGPQDVVDSVGLSAQSTNEANTGEIEDNTTFHYLDDRLVTKRGIAQKLKRIIFSTGICKSCVKGNTEDRIGLVTTEDNSMHYGDDECSESDNEGDL